jgi:hypothetical protein
MLLQIIKTMTAQKLLENFIAKQIIKKEQFANGTDNLDMQTIQAAYGTAGVWSFFILTIGVYLVLMLIGKWLWNSVAVDMITVIKPIESVFQLVGLAILVKLILY